MRKWILSALLLLPVLQGIAQNQDLSGGAVFEGEPFMAVDPGNPQHIVVAWMGFVPLSHVTIKVKTTFNGGATWSSAAQLQHHSPTYSSADVSMAFDRDGNVYASYIDSRKSPDSGAVYMAKSTDGGLTWSASAPVIDMYADGSKKPIDRPWLAIGHAAAPAPDTFYITTKPPSWVAPPNRAYLSKSHDNGATWSWQYIDTAGYRIGNVIKEPMAAPTTDSGGRFHCVYPAYYPAESPYARYLMASGGGTPLNYNVVLAGTGGGMDTLAKAGQRLVCNATDNNNYAYVFIQNSATDIDVFCAETHDKGTTWSAPARVNDDAAGNGKMQDLVWASFDEHGNLVAAWRDRRNAPGSGYQQPSEIWGAVKWKDSAAFSANFRISDTIVAYDSVYLSGSGNDFMNVAMANDTLSAVWGDVRTGVLNIWFSRRAMSTGVSSVQHLVNERLPEVKLYPNPAHNELAIACANMWGVAVYDEAGRELIQKKTMATITKVDLSQLPTGHYIAVVDTDDGIQTIEFEKY